ncbi:MAG: hypothetical protein WD276_00470 [Actinomycetota bacterium]
MDWSRTAHRALGAAGLAVAVFTAWQVANFWIEFSPHPLVEPVSRQLRGFETPSGQVALTAAILLILGLGMTVAGRAGRYVRLEGFFVVTSSAAMVLACWLFIASAVSTYGVGSGPQVTEAPRLALAGGVLGILIGLAMLLLPSLHRPPTSIGQGVQKL